VVIVLEAVFVFGLLGLILYWAFRLLLEPGPQRRRPALRAGHWVTAHYDVDRTTRVVLQKVGPTGSEVLDEHVVASIRVDDPDYDAKFLTAMAAARERRALFASEED
jgi:hypothetical protein